MEASASVPPVRNTRPRIAPRLVAVVLVCICVLAAQAGFAAWSEEPIALGVVHGEMGSVRIAYDGQGGYFVVWNDYTPAGYSPVGWRIRAQHFDAAGDPMWGEEGVLVRGATGYRGSARVVPDGQGGAIVAWDDYENYDLYAQRIGPDGELLWDEEGAAVIAVTGHNDYCAGIVPDGEGGAVILSTGHVNRMDPDGALLWGEASDPPAYTTSVVYSAELVADGSGGAFIAWYEHDDSNGEDNVAVQRVGENEEGDFEAEWNGGDPVMLTTNGESRNPRLIDTDDGGIVVLWHTKFTVTNSELLYAQKIDGSGAPLWDDGKLVASPETKIVPEFHDLASDGSGGAFVTWAEDTGVVYEGDSYTLYSYTVYAQRMGSDGEAVWVQSGSPAPVMLSPEDDFSDYSNAGSYNYPRKTVENGLGGFFTAWYGDDEKVTVQGCDAEGALLWEEGGVELAQGTDLRIRPTLATNGQGGAVGVWTDYHPSAEDIFIQGINVQGVPGDPGYTPPSDDSAAGGSSSSGLCFAAAAVPAGGAGALLILLAGAGGLFMLRRR